MRAHEAGIDLSKVGGSGPGGRISHDDLDRALERDAAAIGWRLAPDTTITEIPLVGVRRRIAEQIVRSKAHIPHITYVDEVDVTALELLRDALNDARSPNAPKLTVNPFLVIALVRAVAEQPHINARFDDEAGMLRQFGGVHVGIATQAPQGLVVPVVHHAETFDIWECAGEVQRRAAAARAGTASRHELTGSTITITSLGALGGLVTTPIINHPPGWRSSETTRCRCGRCGTDVTSYPARR